MTPVSLEVANADRKAAAAARDTNLARRALDLIGDRCPPGHRVVAEARIADPDASWREIATRLGLTKDQVIGRFRRLVGCVLDHPDIPRRSA